MKDITNNLVLEYLEKQGVNEKNIERELFMKEEEVPSGILLKDVEELLPHLYDLLKNEKRITVFGDYDADGVSGTVLAVRSLKQLSELIVGHEGYIKYFIPHRFKDGYGISPSGIDKVINESGGRVDAIITVDNGIVAYDAVSYANAKDIEVIVTDHHEPHTERGLPEAKFVVNPHREDDDYPYPYICGAAVMYKVILAFVDKYFPERINDFRQYIDLVGVATVADMMPLRDENRVYVKEALKIFNGEHPDFQLRYAFASMIEKHPRLSKDHVFTEGDFGFTIGPILNAQSRVNGMANIAINTFLLRYTPDVDSKVVSMININEKRKDIGESSYQAVLDSYSGDDPIVIVRDDNVGAGIIGLVAGRLANKLGKPTVILTAKDSPAGILKGSARSVEGIDLVDNLRKAEDITESLGGHKMAAGLSVKVENFDLFKETVLNTFKDIEVPKAPKIAVADFEIEPEQMNFGLIEDFEAIAPFGEGFRYPSFKLSNLNLEKIQGLSKVRRSVNGETVDTFKHIKLSTDLVDIIVWNEYETLIDLANESETLDAVGTPSVNTFRGQKTLQMFSEVDGLNFK